MDIKRISNNVSIRDKVLLLNNMVIDINSKLDHSNFTSKELDSIYEYKQVSSNRYVKGSLLGNTSTTYSSWTHLKSYDYYSIWKYPVEHYIFNSNNEVYSNSKALQISNESGSEDTATNYFDSVFLSSSSGGGISSDIDLTEAVKDVAILSNLTIGQTQGYYYLFIQDSEEYSSIDLKFDTFGDGYDIQFKYAWNQYDWYTVAQKGGVFNDGTNNFTENGAMSFSGLDLWTDKYIRITNFKPLSTIAKITTLSKGSSSLPSVTNTLTLSQDKALQEVQLWTYYNNNIYITIPNKGPEDYEGISYITENSSVTNKQKYFIDSNVISTNYYSGTFVP